MKNITVLGIGNRLMCDDGIGVYITEELNAIHRDRTSFETLLSGAVKQDWYGNVQVSFISGETDIDFCKDIIKESEFIVIIDAADMGEEPGSVKVLNFSSYRDRASLDPVLGLNSFLREEGVSYDFEDTSSHCLPISMHGEHILRSTRVKEGILIAVQVYRVDYGIGLSDVLLAKVAEVIKNVDSILYQTVKLVLYQSII